MTFMDTLTTAMQKRRRYKHTLAELKSMPLETAWDLDIYQGDAERIASKAVYGR